MMQSVKKKKMLVKGSSIRGKKLRGGRRGCKKEKTGKKKGNPKNDRSMKKREHLGKKKGERHTKLHQGKR